MSSMEMSFVFPMDGDVLNSRDGELVEENGIKSLKTKVILKAPPGNQISVDGTKALETDSGTYSTQVYLDGYRNTVTAVNSTDSSMCEMVVYRLTDAVMKYRISTDDNIRFLKDITDNEGVYTSIFDNPYLKVFKKAHDLYGVKVHFNLFYKGTDFTLDKMTDKFKDEWKSNSDWIKLTFHSYEEFPDRPYDNATYDDMKKDYLLITNEIIRFAGEESLSPITTIHWGSSTLEAARALRTLGVKGLVGYFKYDSNNEIIASYYADNETVDHVNKRDCWKDNLEDIMFVKHDIVLDATKLENIVTELDKIKAQPHLSGIVEMLIHEQYFYPDYKNYQPEYEQKVLTAAGWAYKNGYEPVFYKDIVLE